MTGRSSLAVGLTCHDGFTKDLCCYPESNQDPLIMKEKAGRYVHEEMDSHTDFSEDPQARANTDTKEGGAEVLLANMSPHQPQQKHKEEEQSSQGADTEFDSALKLKEGFEMIADAPHQEGDPEEALNVNIGVSFSVTSMCGKESPQTEEASTLDVSLEEDQEEAHTKTLCYLPTVTTSSDYYASDSHKPGHEGHSRLRICLLILAGIVCILGGVIWAVWISQNARRYSSVDSGQPVQAVLCTSVILGMSDFLAEESSCSDLQEQDQLCSLAIAYNFTLEEKLSGDELGNATTLTTNTTYSGHDILPFASANDACHELVEESISAYLNSTNFTVYYDQEDPHDNRYHKPQDPSAMAAIVVGVASVLGALFICTGFLERVF